MSTYNVITKNGKQLIEAYGRTFPYTDPLNIELFLYKINYQGQGWLHMRNAAFLLWPEKRETWHYWTQRRFQAHCAGYNTITLAGGAASAKALQLNTKIKTPYGWVKMGEIKEGDTISDPHGGVQVVAKVHPIRELPYYKIKFDDGSYVNCCEDHLWAIQTKKDRDKHRHNKVWNTKTLYNTYKEFKHPLSIPRTKAIWQPEQTLPLDPYILGLFIGDGCYSLVTTPPMITLGKAKEICKNYLVLKGYSAYWKNYKNCWNVSLKESKEVLKSLGYLGKKSKTKFIPSVYLQGSIEQRSALLAGLLDTDGTLESKTSYSYTTSSKKLAYQVLSLSRSLGFRASVTSEIPKCNGKEYSKSYTIFIGDCKNGVTLPTLRLHIQTPTIRKHQLITSIEPIGTRKGRCITVSNPDGLYITKDYIVTHNSHDAAMIAILFWLANPKERTVLVASTTLNELQTRIWGYLQKFYTMEYNKNIQLPGRLYSSNTSPKILYDKRDTIHGIFAVPLKAGKDSKPTAGLIGKHPKDGFLAIIDEGTDVNPGFLDAKPNWEQGVNTFQLMVIGNSNSKFDPHGLLSKPIGGWHTVNPDTDSEWETKQGICLYFDCYQSPAIYEKDPDKKKKLGKFLFTEEKIESYKTRYGDNTPAFWRFVRGFWPEDDVIQSVLSLVICDKFHVDETSEWSGLPVPGNHQEGTRELIRIAGIDPAFHSDGDDCVFRWATLGINEVTGKMTLDFGGKKNIHYIKIDDTSSEPPEYQIMYACKKLCKELGISCRNIAVDTWGAGSGFGALIEKEWSKDIMHVESSGRPTDTLIASQSDEKASDVYDRRVTELWFSMRELVLGDQIRGLDSVSMEQFCTRLYETKGRKYSIEQKKDYKMRLGKVDNHYKSPDEADAATFIIDLARQLYGLRAERTLNEDEKQNKIKLELAKQFDYEVKIQEGRDNAFRQGLYNGRVKLDTGMNWDDNFTVSQWD